MLSLYCSESRKSILSDVPDAENLLPTCRRSSGGRVPGHDSSGGTELLPFNLEKEQTWSAVFEAK